MPTVTVRLGHPPVKLIPLNYAEQEALQVAKKLGADALTGRAATKAAVLLGLARHRFIHLATHGIFDDLSDSKSPGAIALAPSEGDNGLLTAEEIARLELTPGISSRQKAFVIQPCSTQEISTTSPGIRSVSAILTRGMSGARSLYWLLAAMRR